MSANNKKVLIVKEAEANIGNRFKLGPVSFEVGAGENVVVLGPNGSGKTSLLRLIAGLEQPTGGEISLGGQILSKGTDVVVPPHMRKIALLFQEQVLFPHLGVRGNVKIGIPSQTSREEADRLVEMALELTQARGIEEKSVGILSGGEKQRVALAMALLRNPLLMLLDEPFHSIDGPLKRQLLSQLGKITGGRKTSTIFVTHEIGEASLLADRIIFLWEGKKIQEGSFRELYENPVNRNVAEFMGEVVEIKVDMAKSLGIEFPFECPRTEICVRPEYIKVTEVENKKNFGNFRVKGVKYHGIFKRLIIDLSDSAELSVNVEADFPVKEQDFVKLKVTRFISGI